MNKRTLIGALAIAMAAIIIPCAIASGPSHSVPTDRSAFSFGADTTQIIEAIESRFASYSDPMDQPLEVPTASETQQQIDAFGDSAAEWASKTEFVFADGVLDMVWVLTSKERVDETGELLSAAGVEPTHSIPGVADFYLDRGFAVRYDPMEFLYFSERLAPFYEAWLESME